MGADSHWHAETSMYMWIGASMTLFPEMEFDLKQLKAIQDD